MQSKEQELAKRQDRQVLKEMLPGIRKLAVGAFQEVLKEKVLDFGLTTKDRFITYSKWTESKKKEHRTTRNTGQVSMQLAVEGTEIEKEISMAYGRKYATLL